jgi:ABC-type transport system substrate-binding protein
VDRTIIPDYSQGLAQFKAGNLWQFTVKPEEILQVKNDHPGMVMLRNLVVPTSTSMLNYSKRPDSIFADVRLRRALAMLPERELYIEAFFNVDQYRNAGLPITTYWHSHLGAGNPEWLDPRGNGLGEGAKYFQHDPAEAKKLVEAAGMKTPVESTYSYYNDRNAGTGIKEQETLGAMLSHDGIFNMKLDPLSYDTSWRAADNSGGMDYGGVLISLQAAFNADNQLTGKYTPQGRSSISKEPLPVITDLVIKMRREVDPIKRAELVKDVQRQAALLWYEMPLPGAAPGFNLRWPWLRNEGIFQTWNGSARLPAYYWYDASKRAS